MLIPLSTSGMLYGIYHSVPHIRVKDTCIPLSQGKMHFPEGQETQFGTPEPSYGSSRSLPLAEGYQEAASSLSLSVGSSPRPSEDVLISGHVLTLQFCPCS